MRKFRLIVIGCFLVGACIVFGWCAGIIRPPRPMFHESYAAGGHGLVYYWIPNIPLADKHGHWVWGDGLDNLLVFQATGTAELGRSHAMVGGLSAARFRLGGAWGDERDNLYAAIPRTRDALIVILPDGGWQQFPLRPGEAANFLQRQLDRGEPSANLLRDAGRLLDSESRAEFDGFLKDYIPPAPTAKD